MQPPVISQPHTLTQLGISALVPKAFETGRTKGSSGTGVATPGSGKFETITSQYRGSSSCSGNKSSSRLRRDAHTLIGKPQYLQTATFVRTWCVQQDDGHVSTPTASVHPYINEDGSGYAIGIRDAFLYDDNSILTSPLPELPAHCRTDRPTHKFTRACACPLAT
ncbi:hypothetical protein Vafri_16064 [Volvox africanus]|uniref:Uncharacterized protein n=1 Tax=Volvox africanus TaxID=51714 RepID=A0A8J4BHI2_9CHLO|nr:hypothetical protein Vafri_16064 [Volvox africanus]